MDHKPSTVDDKHAPPSPEEVYAEAYGHLVQVAYLLTFDEQEARDVVQECFAAALGRWQAIDDHSAYLRRAVTNRSFNATRDRMRRANKAQRHDHRSRQTAIESPEYLADAIAVLPAKERSILVLRYYTLDNETSVLTSTPPPTVGTPGRWTRIDDSPLSNATTFATAVSGGELLAFGGGQEVCSPDQDCFGGANPSVEGAALDLATGRWQRIADVPVPFTSADPVVVDDLVYVWAREANPPSDPTGRGPAFVAPDRTVFLEYDRTSDRWRELPRPFEGGQGYQLVAAGDGLILNPSSDQGGSQPVRRYDPATQAWTVLPDDPLPRLFDRTLTEIGGSLYLFGKHVVPAGSLGREPAMGARLDLATMEWESLPPTGVVGDASIVAVGDTLISTMPSRIVDETQPQPAGRIFDPTAGTWSGPARRPGARARRMGR